MAVTRPRTKTIAASPAPSAKALRGLSSRLAAVREEERTRLSRTLHDELGQMLTSLKLDLAWVAGEVTKKDAHPPLALVNRLQSAVGLVDVTLATVRRISRDLRPPVLDHLGLAEAIKWEATVFEARTGIRCRVLASAARGAGRSRGERSIVLFRILQEALTNVSRHSHAGAVRIELREQQRWFRLEVRDNGRGITAAQLRDPASLGLLGMRERAIAAGGELTVRGAAGRGTTVSVRLPRTTAKGGDA
ncbi:MAG TPA: sensor histidine kinase [Vicinamibacterales bacterium]|jgi:signal transduction histidine kinase